MGIIFCKKQLREAIVAFKKVLAGDEAWLKVPDELELLNEFDDEAVAMKHAPKDIALPSASMQ